MTCRSNPDGFDFCRRYFYLLSMAEAQNTSKLAGRAGSLFALVGILAFFSGLFGAPRPLVFVGVALILLSLVAYFLEEQGQRRAMYR